MIKRILLPFLVVFIFSNLNAQFTLNHSVTVNATLNKNVIEYYYVDNSINTSLREIDKKPNISLGGSYLIDYQHKFVFLRSGVGLNYNKLHFSVINYYVNISLPVFAGINIFRVKLYGGITNSFNLYRFSIVPGTEIRLNKDWCLCELNYYQPTFTVGAEYNLSEKFGIGLLLNLAPNQYVISKGIGRHNVTNSDQLYLTYHF